MNDTEVRLYDVFFLFDGRWLLDADAVPAVYASERVDLLKREQDDACVVAHGERPVGRW